MRSITTVCSIFVLVIISTFIWLLWFICSYSLCQLGNIVDNVDSIDGLVQDSSNSIGTSLELLQSSTKPSIQALTESQQTTAKCEPAAYFLETAAYKCCDWLLPFLYLCCAEFHFENMNIYHQLLSFQKHYECTGSWNLSPWMARIRLHCTVNTMYATKRTTPSARASAVMLLTNSWASYQIRKIAGCAWAGNAGNVFPAADFKENC